MHKLPQKTTFVLINASNISGIPRVPGGVSLAFSFSSFLGWLLWDMMGGKGNTSPRTTTQESYIFHAPVSPAPKLFNYDVWRSPAKPRVL